MQPASLPVGLWLGPSEFHHFYTTVQRHEQQTQYKSFIGSVCRKLIASCVQVIHPQKRKRQLSDFLVVLNQQSYFSVCQSNHRTHVSACYQWRFQDLRMGVFARHARRYAHAQKYFRTHLHGHNGSFMRSNPALFAPLSIVSYPCASAPGTRGRKQRVLHSRPRASCMLINGGQGGCLNTQITPLDTLLTIILSSVYVKCSEANPN